jgi:hypothetical protein
MLIAGLRHVLRKEAKCVKVALRQAFLFRRDPVLVVSRQQWTSVEIDGLREGANSLGAAGSACSRPESGLELRHVCDDGGGIETNRGAIRKDDPAGWDAGRFELAAQRCEGLAEVVAPCREVALGPEQIHEDLSRMRAGEIVGQIGEQHARSLCGKAVDSSLVVLGAQSAEKANPPRDLHMTFTLPSAESMP